MTSKSGGGSSRCLARVGRRVAWSIGGRVTQARDATLLGNGSVRVRWRVARAIGGRVTQARDTALFGLASRSARRLRPPRDLARIDRLTVRGIHAHPTLVTRQSDVDHPMAINP